MARACVRQDAHGTARATRATRAAVRSGASALMPGRSRRALASRCSVRVKDVVESSSRTPPTTAIVSSTRERRGRTSIRPGRIVDHLHQAAIDQVFEQRDDVAFARGMIHGVLGLDPCTERRHSRWRSQCCPDRHARAFDAEVPSAHRIEQDAGLVADIAAEDVGSRNEAHAWSEHRDHVRERAPVTGARSVARAPRRRALPACLATLLVVACALVFRVQGLRWDRGTLLHPDERHLAMVTAKPAPPASLLAYVAGDTTPINPRPRVLHAYGLFPVTFTRLVADVAGVGGAARVAQLGRLLGTAADVVSLLAIGWIGRRFLGSAVAWLAMALYACAVLPIQQSHFFVVDPWLTACATVAIAALTAVHRRASRTAAVVAGLAAGTAVACKLTGALIAVPAAVVIATTAWSARAGATRAPWRWLALFVLTGAVVVRLLAPDMFGAWSLRPSATWLADMRMTLDMLAGHDWPPTHQWARRPVWFAWWNAAAFGLGWPLGVTAAAAMAAASWRALGAWRHPIVVPTVWVLTVVGAASLHLVATMRYLLPAYPAACLVAAWFLVAVVGRASARGAMARRAALALVAVVVAGTAAWAVAFTHVYRELHPRLHASRWIYDNVPAGATIAVEHWDDALPLQAGSVSTPERYRIVTLPVTDADTPAKREVLLALLDRADYVVLSSDRHAGSLVRLPERFPMMVHYYDGLADGSLGFALEREVAVQPRLGAFVVDDRHADEAFSVYDHPRVRIFRRTAAWSVGRARDRLDVDDWSGVLPLTARQASAAPNLLMLQAGRQEGLASEGTWHRNSGSSGRFDATPPTGRGAVLRWLGVMAIVTVSALPICLRIFAHAWLRGALVAPVLGLCWIACATWFWGTFAPWPVTRGVIAGACAALAAISWGAAWPVRRALVRWLRVESIPLLTAVAWLATLGAFALLLRWMNPDLWHPTLGGEKPMDIAILSALVRADRFPVADPWFAGGALNYYWFGYLPVALLCRLTGVEPAVAYNLAVPTWWVLTTAVAAVVGGTLARALVPSVRPGIAAFGAGVTATLLGNLAQVAVVVRGTLTSIPEWEWFWTASRAIPTPAGEVAPITEFPYFTFLFADLHAHMLSMPMLLAGVLAATLVGIDSAGMNDARSRSRIALLGVGGWLLGLLSATNPWDVPVLAAVMAAAVVLAAFWESPLDAWPTQARRAVVSLLGVATVAVLTARPFWLYYGAPAGGVALWRGAKTPLVDWLILWTPFVAPLGLAVLVAWRARVVHPLTRAQVWLGMLLAIGLALLMGVEVAVVRGDVGRMNTVFKTYLAVWLLWSPAVAAAIAVVHARWAGTRRRRLLHVATTCLAIGMLTYPLTATGPRLATRMSGEAPRSLDGRAFLRYAVLLHDDIELPLAEDALAIDWLLDNVTGTPIVMEAQADQYGWGGRISAHTGLPTILGWTWHARQQRMGLPVQMIARRRRHVRDFYTTRDAADANRIASRYGVTYVVVGRLEQAMYPREGLARLASDPAWERVFTAGATAIYRRR